MSVIGKNLRLAKAIKGISFSSRNAILRHLYFSSDSDSKNNLNKKVSFLTLIDNLETSNKKTNGYCETSIEPTSYRKLDNYKVPVLYKKQDKNYEKADRLSSIVLEEISFFRSNPKKYRFAGQSGNAFVQFLQLNGSCADSKNDYIKDFSAIVDKSPIKEIYHKSGDIYQLLKAMRQSDFELHRRKSIYGGDFIKVLPLKLNQICCIWLDKQIQKSNLDSYTKHVCFSLAYTWSYYIGPGKPFSEQRYVRVFLSYFLNDKVIRNLTAQELVFCIFLAGRQREFPQCTVENQIRPDSEVKNVLYSIPEHLEDCIVHLIPDVSAYEVGLVAQSLYRSRLTIQNVHSKLRKSDRLRNSLLNAMLHMKDDEINENDGRTISALSKMLTTHDCQINADTIEILMKKYIPLMHNLDIKAVIRYI